MRRILNAAGLALLVVAVIAGAFAGYLATSNPAPRSLSDGWVRVKSMPGARGETAAAVVERRPKGPRLCPRDPCDDRLVYAAGGIGGMFDTTTDKVQIFDPPANAWRAGPPLPEPRNHAAAAGLFDTLYVTGGSRHTTGFVPESNVWVLRPGRLSFERLAAMPEARTGHAMVAVRSKLYVVAGKGTGKENPSRVMIFDPGNGWSFGAAMPSPRDHAAAVAYQNHVYVIGGRGLAGVSRRVDIYDPATDSWTNGPALPVADSGAAAAVLSDGLIHLVGGEDPDITGGSVRDLHLVLDPVGNVWLEGPKPILAVHGAVGLSVDGRMLIVGGARRQGSFSVFGWTGLAQVFDPTLLQPGAEQPSPTPKRSAPGKRPSPAPSR